MHIIRTSREPKDTVSHTHMQENETVIIATADDLNSDGGRFRGISPDTIMIPKDFKEVYFYTPAWRVIGPALRGHSSIKFY